MNRWVAYLIKFVVYFPWFAKLILRGRRIVSQSSIFFRKIRAGLLGSSISDIEFQRALRPQFSREERLLFFKAYQGRYFFIQPDYKEEIIDSFIEICPQAKPLIIQAADRICDHNFDLLGSGPTQLGWPIDWHADFKSGFRWDPGQYYAEIRPASYPGGYDLKVPWELSRCQHFVWLGQAYWFTGDEKYTHEFRAEVEDWIKQNKPEYGVNWACSMDIAIRAVNWLWGYAFFQSSTILDEGFRLAIYKSLLSHGRHIRANLERTATFTGNHYLSDIVGLIYLGILLPELKEARAWREFGLKELEREMSRQVYPDGGDFEASTSYHKLVTELFLSATLLASLNGYRFSDEYLKRLEKMLDFIFQITKPDGTIPIIGDQDNGRLYRLKVWANPGDEWKDFRPILAIGSVFFNRLDWAREAQGHWEEAIWFYGEKAAAAFRNSSELSPPQKTSVAYADTGIYILRSDDMYVVVDMGPVGQNGKGGHAHNDTLSFELFSSGQTWIQDPGTYLYTSDYKTRNLFRSTFFHNTLVLPPHEQNDINALLLFSLAGRSACRLIRWIPGSDRGMYLSGEMQSGRVYAHTRSFYLDQKERALVVTDSASGINAIGKFVLHFSPQVKTSVIEQPYSGLKLMAASHETAWVFPVSPSGLRLQISRSWISNSYGKREMADVATFEVTELHLKTIILLPGDEEQIVVRLENTLRNEGLFMESLE